MSASSLVPVRLPGAGLDPALAARIGSATVKALAELLPLAGVTALARALPPPLAEEIAGVSFDASDLDEESFYDRVAMAVGIGAAQAREPVQMVCTQLASTIEPDLVARLRRHLPPGVAALLVRSGSVHRPDVAEGHRAARRVHQHLAEARPGSEHPLSSSPPPGGQRGSVAREADPHPGRLAEAGSSPDAIALGRPRSGRPISDEEP